MTGACTCFFFATFKEKALFAKDAEINHAVVLEKMSELLSGRGRRVMLISVFA